MLSSRWHAVQSLACRAAAQHDRRAGWLRGQRAQVETELLQEYETQLLEKEHSGCAALLQDDKARPGPSSQGPLVLASCVPAASCLPAGPCTARALLLRQPVPPQDGKGAWCACWAQAELHISHSTCWAARWALRASWGCPQPS